MQTRFPAIFLAARPQGETAVIARMLSEHGGLFAAYVAGGRGRHLRPVVIPGNLVEAQVTTRPGAQLPFAALELTASRAPYLTQPLLAAAIAWVCALTATVLPERQPYPSVYLALGGLLDAICAAPSARGWAGAVVGYETLLLRELGYGGQGARPTGDLAAILAAMDALEQPLQHYLLAEHRGDVMAARQRLRDLWERIET